MILSPYRLGKAREAYKSFNVFNAISWNLLVGTIITLFALRLGASTTYIGLMGSAVYVALFLLPLGKVLAARFSIIGVFSSTWIIRSLCMLFAVAAPFIDYAGHRNIALLFIILGMYLFHLVRGIGMIGNNPVLGSLATGNDRGSYLTQIQITNSSIGMFISFLVAMVLGLEPPIFVFSILLIVGVVTGVVSGSIIRKVPEPPAEKTGEKKKLVDIFKEAFAQDSLRHFMSILFLVVLVSGVTRTFVVVYARDVFNYSDGMISLFSVFGGLGYLMAGLSVKFLVDRLGAKPLFLVCVIVGVFCLFPVVFFPSSFIDNATGAILFMVFLFFMLNFGFLGSEGIAQTYFLALIPPDKTLNFGILYFFIFGIAGAGGSFFSGLLIDFLFFTGLPAHIAFKILFSIMIVLAVIALAKQKKMKSLGSLPLKDALEVIFSFRDLRAISILDKLDKVEDTREEELLLGALHDAPSEIAVDGLLERARSPRLATRLEAIRALEKLKKLNKTAENALIEDIKNNPYTTAYICARILGNQESKLAVPLLRELAKSNDYMLAGEAVAALSKMKIKDFRHEIEKLIMETQNPRLKIKCAEALGHYKSVDSISVLFDVLRVDNPPPYLRDEVILAVASILNVQHFFYKLLLRYRAAPAKDGSKDKAMAVTLATDEAESAFEFVNAIPAGRKKSLTEKINMIKLYAANLQSAVSDYVKDDNGSKLSRWIMDFPGEHDKDEITIIKPILGEAVLDNELKNHFSLRLLIVLWAARKLRTIAIKVK